MSRKNKKNRRLAQSHPAPVEPPRSISQKEVDERQDRRITWAQRIAWASALFTLVSAGAACWSAWSAHSAYKLTSGKVRARLEFVEQKTGKERFKQFMRTKDGSDQLVFRIESADELARWGPYVHIKNIGGEPIDAIKTEVRYDFGAAYGRDVQQIEPGPIVFNEPSTFEATAFGKLDPGQTAKVYVASLLLHQMMGANFKPYADKDQIGFFAVNVLGRLAGASSYDRMPEDRPVMFSFHWRPAGFKPDADNVKELLAKKPWIVID